MDDLVRASMERWPNVPAVYGWLSLNPRGQWRLHPDGNWEPLSSGESIQNEQILAFIDRNYLCTERGEWYFQNGPQRVFVRLARAPLILSLTGQPMQLTAHTGQTIDQVSHWWIDQQGHLYAQTNLGPSCVNDQDLEAVIACIQTPTGDSLLDWWQTHSQGGQTTPIKLTSDAPFLLAPDAGVTLLDGQTDIESVLGFIREPRLPEPL
ncbi:DUF2946 family protein [Orrella sp. 11846]|uniref:DUF2946 family protein n=1 Tax=Orrella sp. 11846 TaxID=3409913 RepID=UPI003B5AA64A